MQARARTHTHTLGQQQYLQKKIGTVREYIFLTFTGHTKCLYEPWIAHRPFAGSLDTHYFLLHDWNMRYGIHIESKMYLHSRKSLAKSSEKSWHFPADFIQIFRWPMNSWMIWSVWGKYNLTLWSRLKPRWSSLRSRHHSGPFLIQKDHTIS